MVTEADRPRAFAWVVLDDSGDPARPSSTWRYRIDPLPGGGSRVRQRFTHGPGASYLREVAAQVPDRAAEIIAARRDGLQANMSVTLRAMKAAAESSHATRAGPGERIRAWLTGPRVLIIWQVGLLASAVSDVGSSSRVMRNIPRNCGAQSAQSAVVSRCFPVPAGQLRVGPGLPGATR